MKINFDAKTALNLATVAVGIAGVILGNKKDAADKAAFKAEAAEEAAKLVMDQLKDGNS